MEGSSGKNIGKGGSSEDSSGNKAADLWNDDVWGEELSEDVVEQCILLASQSLHCKEKVHKTSETMSALQKSASAKMDRKLAEISSASGPLPPVFVPKKIPYLEPFRKVQPVSDISSLQAQGHSLMGRVQEVLKQKPSEQVPHIQESLQKLTQMQRKLVAPTKSLPSSSTTFSTQATTDWLRSQLEKSNTECEVLKSKIQSKEGESKVLRDKLQTYEKEINKQKQDKMKEIEKVKKQSEERIKELERKLNVAEIGVMFKKQQAESDMFMQSQRKIPETAEKIKNVGEIYQPSTSKLRSDKVGHKGEVDPSVIYELDTEGSSEDETHKVDASDFKDPDLFPCTEHFDDDIFELIDRGEKKEPESDFNNDAYCDEASKETLLNKYLLDSDGEDTDESYEPEDSFYFKLDMGKLLADEISPEIYVSSKVELNFIIAPQVDYDPHTLLYKDFSELIYDKYSDDSSKKLNIWSENPDYTLNPAIKPHFMKELKKPLMKEFENSSDIVERIMDKEMAMLESELACKSDKQITGKETPISKEQPEVQTVQNEEIKLNDINCPGRSNQKTKSAGNLANELGAKCRYFKTLENIHVPLLKLSKAKLWNHKQSEEINQIIDHIKNMGRELFNAVCDPRHLSSINRKNLEMKEREIAAYFNKETHEMDLLSHKSLNDKEKYVDFRRGIALLAVLCNADSSFGKLLFKHKEPLDITEPNDLEFWKNNSETPKERVEKYMAIVYENMNSEYGTKEIDGKISIMGYAKKDFDSFQVGPTKTPRPKGKRVKDNHRPVVENQPYSSNDEIDEVVEKFGMLYNGSGELNDKTMGNYDDINDDCYFNLWGLIENPTSDLTCFSNANGPLLEMMELSKEIENEFMIEGKGIPKKDDAATNKPAPMELPGSSARGSLEESIVSKSFENSNLNQPIPRKDKGILEEIVNTRLEFWEKSFKCEVDPRFNDEVLPFLEPELYTGDKATEAEKSMAGLVLNHHKIIQNKIKDVMTDVNRKFGNPYEEEGVNKCSTDHEKINKMDINCGAKDVSRPFYMDNPDQMIIGDDPKNTGGELGETSNVDSSSAFKAGKGSPAFKIPELPRKVHYERMDVDEVLLEASTGKGKMSDKYFKKSSKKLKLSSDKSKSPIYSGPSSVSDRAKKIMSLIDPQPSTSGMTCENPSVDMSEDDNEVIEIIDEKRLPRILKIPTQNQTSSSKKLSDGHSSRAFLARKRASEHLPEIDEEVEKEIEKLFQPKGDESKDKQKKGENKEEQEIPKLDCPKNKIDIMEECKKFKAKLSTLELVDFVYEIICSIGKLRLTLNFNPLFSSVVELIRSLFNNYIEQYYNDRIDFLMEILREIMYCFPSPLVIFQIQLTLGTAIKFERVVHQMCHNPSMKMSYVDKHDLRFYRGVCFLQVFSFLISNLNPYKVKRYWDIIFYMVRWIYGMYTLHLHIVDAKWYRKHTNDRKGSCKCASVFHIVLFKVLSKCSFYYNLYSDNSKFMDDLTKEKLEEVMLCGVNLADIIVSHDPHFASHMKKRYREYAGFLKALRQMHNDKIVLPPFELSKVDLLLKEEEVIAKIEHDSSRSYETEESRDPKLAAKHYQEVIFFSEVESTNIFDKKIFRDSLNRPFDLT